MRLIKSGRSKTLLALILATLLIISMLPLFAYPASAAGTYYSVTGTVADATMNTITILAGGRYRTFGKSEARLVNVSDGIALRDTVKITYHRDNPKDAVQITMISHSGSQNRIPHDPGSSKSLTGTVKDTAMSTITVLYEGTRYTFSKEDADILNAPDGIANGDKVKIVYSPDDPSRALQIIMVEHGVNHDDDSWNVGAAYRSFTGWVSDMGENYLTVQYMPNGNCITFFYRESADNTPDGIGIGDIVKVFYNDNHPGTACRITMVEQGDNH